jgi:serine/threonine-protein kinase
MSEPNVPQPTGNGLDPDRTVVRDRVATSSSAVPEELTPELRYELHGEVARGGMGVVLRARDLRLNRDLAVKVLRADHRVRPELARRFVEEAQIGGQLQHPGVVPVYELGQFADERPFFTMKLVQGETLATLLSRRAGPGDDLPRFLKIFEQVCQAVAYAHARRVVHRDLKPANVMVGAFGEVQVMDWGLAKVLDADRAGPAAPHHDEAAQVVETGRAPGSGDDTAAGSVLGTYAYMPPEQARGESAGVRSDVFGLGAILCEILTGQPPYTGGPEEVRAQAAAGHMVPVLERLGRCGADAELVRLATACLAAPAEDRPANAGAVAEAVTGHLNGVQERLRRAEVERAAAQARAEEERKRRRVAAALAAAVLLLFGLGGGGWLWIRSERATRQAETEAAIHLALGKATQLREQARKIVAEDAAGAAQALAVWEQALAAAEQAEDIGAAGLVGEETADRAARLLAGLRAELNQAQKALAQARKDARMVADLEKARLTRIVWKRHSFDYAAGAAAYGQAFAAYGLHVLSDEPAATGRVLRRLPGRMREALVVALDDWTVCAPNEEDRLRLREVAGAVDDDPWRQRFRRARDLETFKALAIQAQGSRLPAVSLHLVAIALEKGRGHAEAVALLRRAQQYYPADFWINLSLAQALWELDPRSKQGLGEAIGYYRAAVALRPANAPAHTGLGVALYHQGHVAEGIAEFRKAIALDPKLAPAHSDLGLAMEEQGDVAGAIAEHKKALALDPNDASAHNNLGLALFAQGAIAGAIAEYQKAIALEPTDANAYCNLAVALGHQGRLKQSLASYRRGHELGSRRPGWPYPSAQWVKAAERLVELDRQLPAFLKGKRQPRNAAEGLELAVLCQQPFKQVYGAAARYYCAAFAAEPELANTLRPGHRYNAACAAALASCGKGKDAAGLNGKERSRLRRQALAWLRADLTAWQDRFQQAPKQARLALSQALRHWQKDTDLAGVRDKAALDKLPEAERKEWANFWADVAALLAKASPKK